jgi:hypothetical protein
MENYLVMKIITGHNKIMACNMFYLTSHNYAYDCNHVSIIKVNVNVHFLYVSNEPDRIFNNNVGLMWVFSNFCILVLGFMHLVI